MLPDLPDVQHVWQLHLGGLAKIAQGGREIPDDEVERRRQLAGALRHPPKRDEP